MNNYPTSSQLTTNTNYNDLSSMSNCNALSASALASALNKNCGLDQYRTNFDNDIRHKITDIDAGLSTPDEDTGDQVDADIHQGISNKYSDLDFNDQNVFSPGSSENDLHDGLYSGDPQTPEIKRKYLGGDMLSPYQPIGDLSNDKPPRGSASTQESSPDRYHDDNEDARVESALKRHSMSSGLPNLGNTCYMNSVLQCLFNTEKLSSLLEKNKHYIEKSDKTAITSTFIEALAEAFNHSKKNMSAPLKTFKRALEKVAPIFKGYSQNDAHELFRLLIEKMHDELNHAPKKSGSYVEFTPRDKDIHNIAEEWKRYSKDRDDSLFTSLFGGILLTEVKCDHCGHVSYTFEDALDLSLNIANLKVDSEDYDYVKKLSTCLKDFAEPEFVDGYACDKCKRRDSSYKRTTVWKQPETLVVQLKRFIYDMYGEREAVKDSVSFPLEDLTLDDITHEESNEKKTRYKLYGIVNHMGSLNFGHYIAYVYNEEQECWYEYNDSTVTKIDEEDMIEFARGASEPYILFYRKV